MRAIVKNSGLTKEQGLFKLGVKEWSKDLTRDAFKSLIHQLESNLSEKFCFDLFERLKNRNSVVELKIFVNNLWGDQIDTIDFKASMFKELYKEMI